MALWSPGNVGTDGTFTGFLVALVKQKERGTSRAVHPSVPEFSALEEGCFLCDSLFVAVMSQEQKVHFGCLSLFSRHPCWYVCWMAATHHS